MCASAVFLDLMLDLIFQVLQLRHGVRVLGHGKFGNRYRQTLYVIEKLMRNRTSTTKSVLSPEARRECADGSMVGSEKCDVSRELA